MHLVDEQDDLARGGLDLLEDRFQPLLEFTAILRAGDQGTHVQRQKTLVLQALGHVAVDDAQRHAFGDRRLTDAGFPDQHGVVLGPTAQHLHGAADLVVASDDRVDLALFGSLGQVVGVFLQRFKGILGVGAVGGAALADIIDRLVQLLRRNAAGLQGLTRGAFDQRERGQQAFDGDKAVLGLFGDLLGLTDDAHGGVVHVDLPRVTGHGGVLGDGCIGRSNDLLGRPAGLDDQVAGQTFGVVQQGLQDMFGHQPLMIFADGYGLRRLNEAARPFRELAQVHGHSPSQSVPSEPHPL